MTSHKRYNQPSKGTTDWEVQLNENFQLLDEDVERRGNGDPNILNLDGIDGQKYLDRDTGKVYFYDETIPEWTQEFDLTVGPTSVQTDTASTFAESDVTVTHSNTSVTDNAIQLVTDTDSATRPVDNNSNGFTEIDSGLEFEPQVNLTEITATVSSNTSNGETVYIYETDGTLLTSEPSPGSGNSVTLTASLSAETKYHILIGRGDGSMYTSGYYDTPSFPYTSGTVDITGGTVLEMGTFYDVSNAHSFSSLEATGPTTSGAATVEFSRPSSVRRWESATFQSDQDGQDVEVYVETSSDDGSTWSDWQSKPIGPGTDLTAIPAGDYVRFRVEIARADKTYSPRLTLLSRQYSP